MWLFKERKQNFHQLSGTNYLPGTIEWKVLEKYKFSNLISTSFLLSHHPFLLSEKSWFLVFYVITPFFGILRKLSWPNLHSFRLWNRNCKCQKLEILQKLHFDDCFSINKLVAYFFKNFVDVTILAKILWLSTKKPFLQNPWVSLVLFVGSGIVIAKDKNLNIFPANYNLMIHLEWSSF